MFSGGGIKGFALIGAYEELETRGFQFKRLAGTSAGALIASLIAAGYTSEELNEILDEVAFETFLDERRTWIPFSLAKWFFLYKRLGLYKGERLQKWLASKLEKKGVRTFSDLPHQALRIIVSDLTNGRMVVFPDDLEEKYGIPAGTFSVAHAVRMSCALPYFFEPVKLRSSKGTSLMADGGILSNFPMWLFDEENVNKVRPVIGVKLSPSYQDHQKHEIRNAIGLFEALFETMRDAHDARYISRKHAKNIIFIPTEGVLTTEFMLDEERKQELITLGRSSATQFFKEWAY